MELPVSDFLIQYMNDLAAEDGLSHGSEPFTESEYGVPEVSPDTRQPCT